jgi:small subunit ribosomal protein S20
VPNIKSAKKRMRTNAKRQARNRMAKSAMRTAIRKVEDAIVAGEVEAAQEALPKALSLIGKNARKGVIHKNAGARKSSRLTKRLNQA